MKVQDFEYWVEKSSYWKVDAGEFVLNLASSAGDVKFQVPVRVK